MLKTKQDDEWWLITQPAHAELAGQMAAHWGNDTFASPGHFATSTHPGRLKQEVLLAIAEHDNGWWEWEADPVRSPDNALPQGLAEVVANPEQGMERWRKGIPRLAANHPYASLLISDHASWLYTAQFDPQHSQEFTHPLQAQRSLYPPDQRKRAEGFVSEVRATQVTLTQRLKQDPFWRSALDAEHRWPHARLLQILDALSLGLCSAMLTPADGVARGLGQDPFLFHHVPRRTWESRGPLKITPADPGCIVLTPYPFDEAPLTVTVPAKVVATGAAWRRAPWTLLSFTFLPA